MKISKNLFYVCVIANLLFININKESNIWEKSIIGCNIKYQKCMNVIIKIKRGVCCSYFIDVGVGIMIIT